MFTFTGDMKKFVGFIFLLFGLSSCTENFSYDRAEQLYTKSASRPGKNTSDLREALRQINEVLKAHVTSARAWDLRGMIHCSLGDYAEAVDDFSKVIALKPQWGDAYLYRCMSYYSEKKY